MTSRRGSVEAPVRVDPGLRPGLVFMTLHFPDQVDDEHPHDRRHGPEVRDRRVQGDRGPDRQDLASRWTAVSGGAVDLVPLRRPPPRDDERAAVDAVLGAAEPGWTGGERRGRTARVARGGTRRGNSATCCFPACTRSSRASGWISRGGLSYVCGRLTVPPAEAYGVATLLRDVLDRAAPADGRARVRRHRVQGRGRGGALRRRGSSRQVGPDGATWLRSPCLGMCERAPAALLQGSGEGRWRSAASRSTARPVPARRSLDDDRAARTVADVAPQTGGDARELRLLRRVGVVDPASLDDYRRARGVRGAPAGGRARSRGRDRRAQGLEAPGAGRRRVPGRREVGGGREAAGPTPLLHLQRRRIRARHVQGPDADGARPVRRPGVAHDRRVRDGLRAGLHLHPRRVSARDLAARTRDRRWPRATASSAPTSWARASRSTSSSGAAPAPTSAARRPRCSTRSRASAESPATSRRSRSSAGCSASRPGSTTSRPS